MTSTDLILSYAEPPECMLPEWFRISEQEGLWPFSISRENRSVIKGVYMSVQLLLSLSKAWHGSFHSSFPNFPWNRGCKVSSHKGNWISLHSKHGIVDMRIIAVGLPSWWDNCGVSVFSYGICLQLWVIFANPSMPKASKTALDESGRGRMKTGKKGVLKMPLTFSP